MGKSIFARSVGPSAGSTIPTIALKAVGVLFADPLIVRMGRDQADLLRSSPASCLAAREPAVPPGPERQLQRTDADHRRKVTRWASCSVRHSVDCARPLLGREVRSPVCGRKCGDARDAFGLDRSARAHVRHRESARSLRAFPTKLEVHIRLGSQISGPYGQVSLTRSCLNAVPFSAISRV